MSGNLAEFFSFEFENNLNNKMLYYAYELPQEVVLTYIRNLLTIPIHNFFEYAETYTEGFSITPKEVFQFSNWNDVTDSLCKKLYEINDPGINFVDVGRLLLNDGKLRNDSAYRKYGENHLKTSRMLGLVFNINYTYFLSCIGYVINQLDETEKQNFLIRLILRTKVFVVLIKKSKNERVQLRTVMSSLSDSTYLRRMSNLKYLLLILKQSDEYDFTYFIDNLDFDINTIDFQLKMNICSD